MKKTFFNLKMVAVASLLFFSTSVNGQGFLDKLSKGLSAVESASNTLESASDKLNSLTADDNNTESDSTVVDWKNVKTYTAKAIYEVDDEGKEILDEGGNKKYRVFLIDQNGQKVSPEAVKAQIATVNEYVGIIVAKVGSGALLGALSGGKDKLKSTLIGAATGLGLSVGDITAALSLKKDLNRQKKVLEAYQRNFDAQGKPISANIKSADLKALAINLGEASAESTSKIKEELASEAFSNSTTVLDDLLDNLNK